MMTSNNDQRIREKIMSIAAIEANIPGVIIIHDVRDSSVVYMSHWGLQHLGVTMKELIQMGKDYHNRFFNPEDAKEYVPKIFGLMESKSDNEFISFFQQVRRSPQHEWAWFLSATKVCLRDEEQKPLLILTTAIPVDTKHQIADKAQRLLDENNFLRQNHQLFDSLTKREKEILRMIALGLSSISMSKQMQITVTTATTHRRNIKRKLKAKTNYDITRFAQAFGLI